jgi:hypothetical protein
MRKKYLLRRNMASAAKADSEKGSYRSGEPLRHPKTRATAAPGKMKRNADFSARFRPSGSNFFPPPAYHTQDEVSR